MFRLSANLAVYLHRGTIDFRKNINGLSALVEHELRLDPFAHAVYVFGNRRKDRIKILGWSSNTACSQLSKNVSFQCPYGQTIHLRQIPDQRQRLGCHS